MEIQRTKILIQRASFHSAMTISEEDIESSPETPVPPASSAKVNKTVKNCPTMPSV